MKLATDEKILNGWYSKPFSSPFPSEDALLSEKFKALRKANDTAGGASRFSIIEQGQAFSAAIGVCNAAKAVHVGDLLTDWLPRTAWMTKGVSGDLVQGLFATVPWDGTFDPELLAKNMMTAGLTVALTTLAAVPVYGQIAAALVAVAAKLLDMFLAKGDDQAKALLLPWTDYTKSTDELIVEDCRKDIFRSVDWTRLFLPPFDVAPWTINNVPDKGMLFIPRHKDGDPAFSPVGIGCMPGTLKVAGQVQLVDPAGPAEALVRRIHDGYGNARDIPWRAGLINCGDYYPATAQLGAAVWQQALAAGNPDMYKLDAHKLLRAWEEYYDNLFASAAAWMEPGKATYNGFVRDYDAAVSEAIEASLCWRLEGSTEWTIGVPEGHRNGPFWHELFHIHGPVRKEERTPCLFVEEDIRDGKKLWPYTFNTNNYPQQHPKLRATGRKYRGPVESAMGGVKGVAPKGYRCVPYPTQELARASYTTPFKAFIEPAAKALWARQLNCLTSTLVCAYVRPEGYEDLAPYAAFVGAAGTEGALLKTTCLEARAQLLTHDARFAVNLKDVDAIDPQFGAKLRAAGVTNSVQQRIGVRGLMAAGGGADLGGTPPPPAPPTGGGVPFGGPAAGGFDFAPAPGKGNGGGKGLAAAAAGAALLGLGLKIAKSHR